jgi:hypothetical protein
MWRLRTQVYAAPFSRSSAFGPIFICSPAAAGPACSGRLDQGAPDHLAVHDTIEHHILYDITVPEGKMPGDTFDAPFAEQDIHKDITRQMFRDVLDTAIHSVLVTGKDAAQLRIHPPDGDPA